MTFEKLLKIMVRYEVPFNAKMESDSGWECDATPMDGIFYNRKKNILVFTQGNGYENYIDDSEWEHLHGKGGENFNMTEQNNIMSSRYTVRFGDADNKRLNEYCERSGKSRSDVLREGAMKVVNEYEKSEASIKRHREWIGK